jgi:hypothetical protein
VLRRTCEQENVIRHATIANHRLGVSLMDTTGWQPIEMAPPETRIWLGLIENGRLKRVGMGRISKPQDSEPMEYHWVHTDVAPTHWKPTR